MATIKIGPEEAGSRIDRILRKRLSLMKLSEIYSLLRKGAVRIGGQKVKKQDHRVSDGDVLEIDVNESEIITPKGPDSSLAKIIDTEFYKRNFRIIYEDPDLLACDKPSGLVVHPGTGHLKRDTLIELACGYLISKGKLKEGEEPALVHRLDRDTSGVILIAKSKRIVRQINDLFRSRDVVKQYCAICHSRPPEFEGEIVVGLERTHEDESGTKMQVSENGVLTKTRYRILEFNGTLSKLELFLDTGKTHQIRVHLSHVKAPIVGDVRYGDPELDKKVLERKRHRLYLHAKRISFVHPMSGKKITITADEPVEFRGLLE